jgi:hypothetical protein
MLRFASEMLAVPLFFGLVVAVLVFIVEKWWSFGAKAEVWKAVFAFLMTTLLAFNLQTLYDLNRSLKRSSLDQLEDVKRSLDPDFMLIFGSHVNELIAGFRTIVEHHEMRLSDIDQYRYFYRRFLAAYPGITFYATSLPREEYFWSPGEVRKNSVEEAIRDYIVRGGRFERIFFISDEGSPKAADEEKVMRLHHDLGIKVYYIREGDLQPELRRCFLVASNGKVASEATLGMNNKISELVITVDEERAQDYLRRFEKLKQNPKLQEYGINAQGAK